MWEQQEDSDGALRGSVLLMLEKEDSNGALGMVWYGMVSS